MLTIPNRVASLGVSTWSRSVYRLTSPSCFFPLDACRSRMAATRTWKMVQCHGPSPGVRENNGVVEYKGSLYLFGGYNGSMWLNDFHGFHIGEITPVRLVLDSIYGTSSSVLALPLLCHYWLTLACVDFAK